MVNERRLVDLFKEVCLIDAPSLNERESVLWTKKYLQDIGLEVREDEAGIAIGGNANNLIATLKGNVADAPRVFLSAHFDTVEPTAGLVIGEKDGVLFSESDTILGADDKGGMAPAIEAVHCLIESGEPHGDVVLIFSCAEEIGLLGAAALDIQSLGLDYGYVLDTGPPVGSFVTRTATHDKLEVTLKGRPAHAGKDPEKGISAIQVAADAIAAMKLGRIGPETTANIGVISGGSTTNVVCPEVRMQAEARSTDESELNEQIDHMVATLEWAAHKWGAEVNIVHRRHYRAYSVDEESLVVTLARRASKRLGYLGELRTTLGGSDANVYNAKGVPCIVMGTGMEKIHTHDECISIADLVATAELTYEILRESAKSPLNSRA